MKVKTGSEEVFINWEIVFNNLDRDFYGSEAPPPPPGDKKKNSSSEI